MGPSSLDMGLSAFALLPDVQYDVVNTFITIPDSPPSARRSPSAPARRFLTSAINYTETAIETKIRELDLDDQSTATPASDDQSMTSKASKDASDEQSTSTPTDDRTTIMLRNVPRKYNQRQLLTDLSATCCLDACDFYYLPTAVGTGRNQGYCFLNFATPEDAQDFKASAHKLHLHSGKYALSVGFAVVQGLQRNLGNIRRTSLHRIKNPELRPFVRQHGVLAPVPPNVKP